MERLSSMPRGSPIGQGVRCLTGSFEQPDVPRVPASLNYIFGHSVALTHGELDDRKSGC
jgi:hypothetical protein